MWTGLANAGLVVVPVAEDASTNTLNPDGAIGSITTRGGLLAGLDSLNSNYSFYLKFNLPTVSDPITGATLRGFFNDDFGGSSTFVGVLTAQDDSWSESTITANTQPLANEEVGGSQIVGSAVGSFVEFDVTPVVQSTAIDDGILTLALFTIDGRSGDLKFFASKEFNSANAFTLNLETAGTAIPLPPAGMSGIVGLGVAWVARRWFVKGW